MVNVLKQTSVNVILAINLQMGRIVFASQFVNYHVKMQNVLSQMCAHAQMVFAWPMKVNRTNAIAVCFALKSMITVIVWMRTIVFRVIAFAIIFHRFVPRVIV